MDENQSNADQQKIRRRKDERGGDPLIAAMQGLVLPKPKLEKALDRAYQLRTFEIEHHWRRATYFWGVQIVIFAAFGLLGTEIAKEIAKHPASTEHPWNLVVVALSGLGALTCFGVDRGHPEMKEWFNKKLPDDERDRRHEFKEE